MVCERKNASDRPGIINIENPLIRYSLLLWSYDV